MPSMDYPAIVLVAYGSVYPEAMATYAGIVDRYQKEFSGSEVKLAFTSEHIRRKVAEKEGIAIPSPLTALADLQDHGNRDVAVQSLHIVPGGEFHETAHLVNGLNSIRGRFGLRRLGVGRPLLASLKDCQIVSFALKPILDRITHKGRTIDLHRDPEEEAVVLVGHGSSHPGECIYSQMASILKQSHKNVFLGTLEGYPGLEEVIANLEESGVKRARMVPFLLVAGGHVFKDVAGNDEGSWRSIIGGRGFQTRVLLQGLGESEEIVGLLLEHTKMAVEKMAKRECLNESSDLI
jgi:sirohydrochlorin cobaltochelatase